MEVIYNMWRRKTRTLLTVFGIAIGVMALVVMGSMAEKLNLLIENGIRSHQDKVQVTSSSTEMSFAPMEISTREQIASIKGVEFVSPIIYYTLESNSNMFGLGVEESITAYDQNADQYGSYSPTIYVGRKLTNDETGKAVVGYDLAKKLGAELDKNITVKGKKFEVVGIWQKSFSTSDATITVSLLDGQSIIYDDLPTIIKSTSQPSDIVTSFEVYPVSGTDPDALATKIQNTIPGVAAVGPKQFKEQYVSSSGMINSIIYGIAIISLIVGSLSIINTMMMSVGERTREIGIKKAIGAKTVMVLREYVAEAIAIGFIGGVVGVILGFVIVNSLNNVMEASGDGLFLFTPLVAFWSIIFSIVLGIIAGFMPAIHATRINIVKALGER